MISVGLNCLEEGSYDNCHEDRAEPDFVHQIAHGITNVRRLVADECHFRGLGMSPRSFIFGISVAMPS